MCQKNYIKLIDFIILEMKKKFPKLNKMRKQEKKMDITTENATKMLNQLLGQYLPKSASYRFFEDKKRNKYFWTTERIEHLGKQRFVSGVYRYFKMKKHWIAKKKVFHAKRNKAKARAYKMYQKTLAKQ